MRASRTARWIAIVGVLGLLACVPLRAAKERLEFRHVVLDLPGPPARIIPDDLDADGIQDLVVVVAYTEIEDVGETRVEDLIEISRVVPTLFDRREIRAYLGAADGNYHLAGAPLEMPRSTIHLEPLPSGSGIVALTDDGLARLILDVTGDGTSLRLEPMIEAPPVLARSGVFFPALELVRDLDGDGTADLLLPTPGGPSVYLGHAEGFETSPAHRLELASEDHQDNGRTRRWYPLPEVHHVNGDEYPDLVFEGSLYPGAPSRTHVFLGLGEGRFGPMRGDALDCHDRGTDLRWGGDDPERGTWPDGLIALRDIDGDRRAEAVIGIEKSRGDSWRKEMKDAKKPIWTYRFHELREDLLIEPEPYFEMKVVGHSMDADDVDFGDREIPFRFQQFVDLDGDGREDLVTFTLEFSLFQVLKIMATKKIGIGFNFHIYHQKANGKFEEVPNLDLSEKLKLDLNDLKIGRFAQFAGDFDGDGTQDFAHLGRGSKITLHSGRPGCRYPKDPDLILELEEEPLSLDLVRIEDIDGDGLSDLRVTRPSPISDPDVTAPVRVDLYLSASGR